MTLRELLARFTGYLPVGILGRGTPSSSVFLRGDGRWATTPAAGGPATQVQESSGPTVLTVGAIADGEFAKRVGSTLVGAAAAGGGAPAGAAYLVLSLDPTLSADRKLVAGTGLTLTDGGAGGDATLAPDFGSGAGKVAQGNDARLSDDRVGSGLRTATTVVVVSASAAPAAKDVLRALESSSAAWVPENGPGGVGGHTGGGGLARLYVPGARGATALTTGAPTANVLRAVPFVCPNRKGTIDQLSLRTTVGGAGSSARLGLYRTASSANLYPGALIAETAALGTTGVAHTVGAVSATFDPGEILWVAHVASATVPTIACIALASADVQLLGHDSALGNAAAVGVSVAHTFGALPATFTAGGAVITAAPIPAIGVRFAT